MYNYDNMKKHTLIIFLLLIVQSVHAQNEMIAGTWQEIEDEDTTLLIFDSEGYAVLNFNQETIGGKSYSMDGLECSLRYKLDFSKSPTWIDFIIISKEDDSEFDFMLGIIEFSDDSTEMRMCLDLNKGNKRPENFIEMDTAKMIRID